MKTLLVGNDVNNINNPKSWEQLLQGVLRHCRAEKLVRDLKSKPFPLLYEEILLKSKQRGTMDEAGLKRFIAGEMKTLLQNEIHERIRRFPVKDILTTNYDFNLSGDPPGANKGVVKETRFSVFRHYEAHGRRWWHLHGDSRAPASINLGFEHYGGQLHRIRSYVVTGTEYQGIRFDPLFQRLGRKGYRCQSWVDLFFTHDICILGLALDFVETDLWWLLTWRARQLHRFPKMRRNRIVYFIPGNYFSASQPRLDLFAATGVEVIPLNAKTKTEYYHRVLDRAEKW